MISQFTIFLDVVLYFISLTSVALTEPMMSGLGGGCFFVFYNAEDSTIYTVDGREEAPENFPNNTRPEDR